MVYTVSADNSQLFDSNVTYLPYEAEQPTARLTPCITTALNKIHHKSSDMYTRTFTRLCPFEHLQQSFGFTIPLEGSELFESRRLAVLNPEAPQRHICIPPLA